MSSDTGPARAATSISDAGGDKLVHGRLIIALDALLETGSATLAAKRLGLQTSGMSRILSQLRQIFDDPIFIRSGRGLVPTPLAETIRPLARSVAHGIDAVFQQSAQAMSGEPPFDETWNVISALDIPDLVVRPANLLEGQPSPQQLSKKFASVGDSSTPHKRLAKSIATISTGTGHRRPMTEEEAHDAMDIMLLGDADPIQIGALLGIMQTRGPTAAEVTGFVQSTQTYIAASFRNERLTADIDWPCYSSPNQRNPPWFFHAARLVAEAGHSVLLHGSTGSSEKSGRLEVIAKALGISICTTADDAARALSTSRIAYVPLVACAPQTERLLRLSELTGTRSPIHSVVFMLNPGNALSTVTGVSKPSYPQLHRDVAMRLNRESLAVFGNTRGTAQFTPFRATTIQRLVQGTPSDIQIASIRQPTTSPRGRTTTLEFWQGVWSGAAVDDRAEKIIVSTAAAALQTLNRYQNMTFEHVVEHAAGLWKERRRR